MVSEADADMAVLALNTSAAEVPKHISKGDQEKLLVAKMDPS